MSRQLTLVASLHDVLAQSRALAHGYELRATVDADAHALAELYLAAYPTDIVAIEAEAEAEMARTFAGEYGRLDVESSPVATLDGEIVGALMTVDEGPSPDTPPGRFVIELIVHPEHRRRGVAECLLQQAARTLTLKGAHRVGLRVMSDNVGAQALYAKVGFRPWVADDQTEAITQN